MPANFIPTCGSPTSATQYPFSYPLLCLFLHHHNYELLFKRMLNCAHVLPLCLGFPLSPAHTGSSELNNAPDTFIHTCNEFGELGAKKTRNQLIRQNLLFSHESFHVNPHTARSLGMRRVWRPERAVESVKRVEVR